MGGHLRIFKLHHAVIGVQPLGGRVQNHPRKVFMFNTSKDEDPRRAAALLHQSMHSGLVRAEDLNRDGGPHGLIQKSQLKPIYYIYILELA